MCFETKYCINRNHFVEREVLGFPSISQGIQNFYSRIICLTLRVVFTKAILCLKSMSERDGYDIQRLCNWMMNFKIESKTIEDDILLILSRSMSDPSLSDIDFKNKMALVWTTLKCFHRTFNAGVKSGCRWYNKDEGEIVVRVKSINRNLTRINNQQPLQVLKWVAYDLAAFFDNNNSQQYPST